MVEDSKLFNSSMDIVALAEAVEQRLEDLFRTWLRVRGTMLKVPAMLERDVVRWRVMRNRHQSGDLRHSHSELESLKSLAQWSLDKNCEMRGQPNKKIEWRGI